MVLTTLNDVIDEFKRLGWKSGSNAGDHYVLRVLGDRVLKMYIEVDKHGKPPAMIITPFISTPVFDSLIEQIADNPHPLTPLIGSVFWGRKSTLIPSPITEETVAKVSKEFIRWARLEDLEAAKAYYRSLPTNCAGLLPVIHLAALAEAGDVEKLQSYADAFARGDRLGFVPYITEDYIARALEIAKERASEMGA